MNDLNRDPDFGRDFLDAMARAQPRPITEPPLTLAGLRDWHVDLGDQALKLGNRWLEHGVAKAAAICLQEARFHKRAIELIDAAIEGVGA